MNRTGAWLALACVLIPVAGCGGGAGGDTEGTSKVQQIEAYLDAYDRVVRAAESVPDVSGAQQAAGEIQAGVRSMEQAVAAMGGDAHLTLTGLDAANGARVTALDRRLRMARTRIEADPALAKALRPALAGIPGLQ